MNRVHARILTCAALLLGAVAAPSAGAAIARRAVDDDGLRNELARNAGNGAAFAADPASGVLRYAGGSPDAPLAAPAAGDAATDARTAADRFVDRYGRLFGIDSRTTELAEPSVHEGAGTVRGIRYDQRYQGLPVIAGQLAVQVAADGAVLSTTATISADVDVATTPAIDAEQAVATATALTAKYDHIDAAELSAAAPTLSVFDSALLGAPGERRVKLVWDVDVRTEMGDVDRTVFVDAATGAIALTFSEVHTALNRSICNAGLSPTQVPCTNPVRSEGHGNTGVADVDQAYVNAGAVYAYYQQMFGRDSVDGEGLQLRSTVNYCPSGSCPNYANAYWSGDEDKTKAQMVYGHGFAAGDDVVAHEMTHAVTQYESGLIYYGQPGAINESLSDIFGELIDLASGASGGNDSPAQRWEMGEDIPGGAIRSMSNPPKYQQPDSMLSGWYHTDSSDNFGVHVNSGVSNKAAYLLVDGGSHNPGTGNVTVSPIGAAKTARLFYEVQTNLLTPGAQFSDLANAMRQACRNLTGTNGFTLGDCTPVEQAIRATAMDQPPAFMAPHTPTECVAAGRQPADRLFFGFEEGDTATYTIAKSTPAANFYLDWSHPDTAYPRGGQTSLVGWDTQVFANPPSRTPGDTSIMPDATVVFPPSVGIPETYLSFDQSYDMEWTYDGGVVEYSLNGGAWTDLLTAVGPSNVFNGYDATLQNTTTLETRPAFTGVSPGYFTTRILLTSTIFNNTTARFRWRMASDNFVVGNNETRFPGAWFIDNIRVYDCVTRPSAPDFPTAVAGQQQATVSWSAPAVNAGGAITDYVITPYRNGVARPAVHTNSGALSHVVTGLTGGATYQFTVAAVNSTGQGAASGLSNAVVPASPPTTTTATTLPGGGGGTTTTIPGRGGGGGGGGSGGTTTTTLPRGGGGGGGGGAEGEMFAPVSPTCLFDTRPTEPQGAIDVTKQRYGDTNILRVKVTGTAGIPTSGVGAVSLNVTAVAPDGHGFVTVYPCGDLPLVSNINYTPGSVSPNAVITPVSDNGDVCFYSYADTDLIADVNGWFPADGGLGTVDPTRPFDTRPTEPQGVIDVTKQRYGDTNILRVKVTGTAGIPTSGVGAVSLNVTAVAPDGHGFVTVYPCGDLPLVSNINYTPGSVSPNAVITPVSDNGDVCFYSYADTDLIADVNGWFPADGGLGTVDPTRLFDTRPTEPQGAIDVTKQRYGDTNILRVKVTGTAGIPTSGVGAVSLNVTAVAPDGHGFVTVYPCGDLPLVSNINYTPGSVSPNAVITPVSDNGDVCFYSYADTDLIADINGWFAAE